MRVIPKAELHVHLEGTMAPVLARRLARRHGIRLDPALFAGEDGYAWTGFDDFLRVYDAVSRVVRTPGDYLEITRGYLEACAAEGAIYVELTASPDHARAAGLGYDALVAGVAGGIEAARAATGIQARIVMTSVRHFGIESCVAVAETMARRPHELVTGFNLAGAELGHPPGRYARAFAIAHDAGLGCTVHAGEWGGPELIREALALPVTRIGHGIRAVEDPSLLHLLAERGVTLEVCPGSNVATGAAASLEEHPLRRLVEAGVRCTLGSDDPPYFATSIGAEYDRARDRMGFDDASLRGLTRNALEAAFADADCVAGLLGLLDGATATADPPDVRRAIAPDAR